MYGLCSPFSATTDCRLLLHVLIGWEKRKRGNSSLSFSDTRPVSCRVPSSSSPSSLVVVDDHQPKPVPVFCLQHIPVNPCRKEKREKLSHPLSLSECILSLFWTEKRKRDQSLPAMHFLPIFPVRLFSLTVHCFLLQRREERPILSLFASREREKE